MNLAYWLSGGILLSTIVFVAGGKRVVVFLLIIERHLKHRQAVAVCFAFLAAGPNWQMLPEKWLVCLHFCYRPPLVAMVDCLFLSIIWPGRSLSALTLKFYWTIQLKQNKIRQLSPFGSLKWFYCGYKSWWNYCKKSFSFQWIERDFKPLGDLYSRVCVLSSFSSAFFEKKLCIGGHEVNSTNGLSVGISHYFKNALAHKRGGGEHFVL